MNKILITIIFLLISFWANAQNCWETTHTPTTDWRSSASNNTWDWTQRNYTDIYITNQNNPVSITSPFWATGAGSVYHNASLFDFQKYSTNDKKDFHPEDGWELLVRNFGTAGNANDAVNYPFFALYNRYNGKVRAFLLIPDKTGDLSKTGAMLKVAFPDKMNDLLEPRKTAIFQHMKPIGYAVESFDGTLNADMTNVYSNEDFYWIYSEFTVAYDPCTCADLNSSRESTVEFTYFLIEESEIDANISGTLTEKVTSNQKPTKSDPSFALNDLDAAKKAVEAGQKGYKTWQKYESTFNKQLKEYTDSAYRDKLWKSIDTLRTFDPSFFSFVTKSIFKNWQTVDVNRDNFINGSLIVEPENLLIRKDNDFLNSNYSNFKQLASVLPYVGAAIGVIDLFVDGGEKTTAVKGPTVFEANLVLDGTIKKVTQATLNGIYTPGYTTTATGNNFIPTYNNILGVFNVLELPDFEYFEIKPDVTNKSAEQFANQGYYNTGNACKLGYSDFHNEDGAGNVIFKQYKPKSNLKYVLNPASNLEVISVEAAIVLDYNGSQKLYIEDPSDYSSCAAFPFHTRATAPQDGDSIYQWEYSSTAGSFIYIGGIRYNILGQEIETRKKQYETGSATVKRIKDIETSSNLELDYVSINYPLKDTSNIRFRTSYLPVSCFDQQSFTILGSNNFGKIFTKLYVRLKRKDDPNASPITLVLCYDLSQKITTAAKASQTGQYKSEVVGKSYLRDYRCCWKCGTDMDFWSIDISDYSYNNSNFELMSVPFGSQWFMPRNMTYSGEQFINTVGNLEIPDNTIIPPNSLLRAAGKITLGSNVTIGSATVIQSEIEIDLSKTNSINPNVIFEIVRINAIKSNCTNYNYSSGHLSNDSIFSFCNSMKYKQKSVLYKRQPIDSSETKNSALPLDFKVYPNPNNGYFVVEFPIAYKSLKYELLDLNGRVVLTNSIGEDQMKVEIDAKLIKSGIYFLRLSGPSAVLGIKRVVKI